MKELLKSVKQMFGLYHDICIVIAIICVPACSSGPVKKPDTNVPPKFVAKTEPKFKKQGNLTFLNEKNGKVRKEIDIEIADNDEKRETGLMYRKSLADNQGMLFIFDKPEMQSFWMKNTYLPLDIIFADENGHIVTIQKQARPLSEESIPSFKPALYVIEVNAGFTDKYGVIEGDKVNFR